VIARAVNAAADVIHRAQVNGAQTATGLAFALDSARMLVSPEEAARSAVVEAERDALKARVEELEAERHSTNEALSDITVALREREVAPLMVYRASHDSIVVGLYSTAAEARKHCEALVRREYDETSRVHLWWREDEDTVDQSEDGEQELYEHVKSAAVPGPGWTHRTGYVVTPLEVASAYDEEADE
jgi:hypothetical protein